MKVLHYQHNGVGVILSEQLQNLGVESRVLATAPHPFGFKEDFLFSQKALMKKFLRRLEWRKYHGFNILHNHENLRLPNYVLKHWRGRMVQHYYDPNTREPLYAGVPSFAALPCILKAVPNASFQPLPVDTTSFKAKHREERYAGMVRIGYCDLITDPRKSVMLPKKEMFAAIQKCKVASLYPLMSIIPHQNMPSYYQAIDIWVDRFGMNIFGFAAVEAAAMGVPVICEIGDYERDFVPDCPFIATTRENVTEKILDLVGDAELRKTLGQKARAYIVKYHDARKLAANCLSLYNELVSSNEN